MAKTLIGNIKGQNGRGIVSIKKTGTDGAIDTYTITYTDDTTSTFTVNNSDNVLLQRQIVPSAAVESSATASQAYAAGDYVVVNGVLRKVKSAIARGNTIGDSNSTATTVTGEIGTLRDSIHQIVAYGGESGTINVDTSSWEHGFYYLAAFVPYPNDDNDMFDAFVSKDDRGKTHLKVLHGTANLAGSVITVSLSWYCTITRTLLART